MTRPSDDDTFHAGLRYHGPASPQFQAVVQRTETLVHGLEACFGCGHQVFFSVRQDIGLRKVCLQCLVATNANPVERAMIAAEDHEHHLDPCPVLPCPYASLPTAHQRS